MQLPQNFTEWKNCIEVKCNTPLTKSYVQQRIEALSNPNDIHTKEFIQLYGVNYTKQIIQWFHQAY